MAARSQHPLWSHLLDKGFVTKEELHAVAARADEVSRRAWGRENLAYVAPSAPDFRDDRTVYTSLDPEKQQENREAWEAEQHRLSRSSVVALSREDEADDDRDNHGGYIVNDYYRRNEKALEAERVGIEFETKRLREGRQPWMHPKTFRWIRDKQRAEERAEFLRSKADELIIALGGCPTEPKVAEWVNRIGVEEALVRLEIRALNSGVDIDQPRGVNEDGSYTHADGTHTCGAIAA